MSTLFRTFDVIRRAWGVLRARRWPGLIFVGAWVATSAAQARSDADFRCAGMVETEVWQMSDESAHACLREEMMQNRLSKGGDTYALYDMQVYGHNLAAMAARCGRVERLKELAALMDIAFDAMTEIPGAPPSAGKGWVSRGGCVCNATNRLVNTEVALNSQQFLAFAMRVASALSAAPDWPVNRPFDERAVVAAPHHLQRWTVAEDPLRLVDRRAATPASIRDGSSRLFFQDAELGQIDIASEVAGVLVARPEINAPLPNRGFEGSPREAIVGLLELLRAQTTAVPQSSKGIGKAIGADIDRGCWRLYRDTSYAGYAGTERPAECRAGKPARGLDVPPPVDTIGWDFSHARRLVPVMDAVERNRAALQRTFKVAAAAMPAPELPQQFAAQLAGSVWTGDPDYPLFANYWNGTNGWYRVAYDNGTSTCLEGYPPAGLSAAFTTGGFVNSARFYPVIGELGVRLYRLSLSDDWKAREFIAANYSQLAPKASANSRMLTQLMFWPSLVQLSTKS